MDPGRFWGVVLLGVTILCADARAEENVRLLVQNSPLAGFRYHAAAEVWRELRVGDRLELAREPGNPHDANAVKVLWRGHTLGYVPRRENAALAWGLDRGTPLRARISALSGHPNPARRVRFDVYVE
jgi:hypothetical protein